jgi:large subunit ribosomal protein L24
MATYKRIRTGDTVKIISGAHKGETAKVVRMLPSVGKAQLEDIGVRTRHIRANQYNPKGQKKNIHVGLDVSKLQVVERATVKPQAAKTTTKPKATAKKGAKQ